MLYVAFSMLVIMSLAYLWSAISNPSDDVYGRFVSLTLAILAAVGSTGVWEVM